MSRVLGDDRNELDCEGEHIYTHYNYRYSHDSSSNDGDVRRITVGNAENKLAIDADRFATKLKLDDDDDDDDNGNIESTILIGVVRGRIIFIDVE
jgi:hypothetical protein